MLYTIIIAGWLSLPCVISSVSNNIIEDTKLQPTCDALLKGASTPPIRAPLPATLTDLEGSWVSKRCETRAGPIFVTRSYSFTADGEFTLDLHQYEDAACSRPSFSLNAHGRLVLERPSLLTPGGTEADYTIIRLTAMPHTNESIEEITSLLNTTDCPTPVYKRMKLGEATLMYHSPWSSNKVSLHTTECLLISSWHELQLLRVEKELSSQNEGRRFCSREEMHLGDLHSDPLRQEEYRPTAYQEPLINSACIPNCTNCQLMKMSSLSSPPKLAPEERLRLPSIMEGSWASIRCEVQRFGFFLTRIFAFSAYHPRWHLQQRYFDDPDCKNATYTIQASGSYKKKGISTLIDAEEYDLTITKMSVTPNTKTIATQLNKLPRKLCGRKGTKWSIGERLDITKTRGCPPIGLKVPAKQPEILRLIEDSGNLLLYLGQTPTLSHQDQNIMALPSRPTSFNPPLQKCTENHSGLNHMVPQVGAHTSSSTTTVFIPQLYQIICILVFIIGCRCK